MDDKHHLLLAVDGSDTANEAVEFAGSLAHRYEAITHVIYVSPDLREVILPDAAHKDAPCHAHESVTDSEMSYGERILARAEARLKERGVKDIRLLNELGNPAERIARAAERNNCTVIVIGSRGLGGIAGFVLGSVSRAVVNAAPCSVLVVKPGSTKIGPQRRS